MSSGKRGELQENFIEILGAHNVLVDEPMNRHCSFRIGGPADYLLSVDRVEQLRQVLALVKTAGVPYFILGRGTNLLVGDGGYHGVVITMAAAGAKPVTDTTQQQDCPVEVVLEESTVSRIGDWHDWRLGQISVEQDRIFAGAGASLSQVALAARDHGLSGLEFAAGIPGSVGGGLVMNAGAYGGEMKDVVSRAVVLTQDGEVKTLGTASLHFGYRHSLFSEAPAIALGAVFQLKAEEPAVISARIQEYASRRKAKQPLEYPSAGSTFKRPEGHYAGKLIEEAGLRGFSVGGACVSSKHCGFVINRDHATAADVRAVISKVQKEVFAHAGVKLEPEIIFLGDFL